MAAKQNNIKSQSLVM